MEINLPELEEHNGILVARDTLKGGTKSRYLWQLFLRHHEVVYSSSAEGTAQVALAATAQRWGKRAIIFGPSRTPLHPRQREAIKLGAEFHSIQRGYLNVCEAQARKYAATHEAFLLPFGAALPRASKIIAQTAKALKVNPTFIWCASGSGTLAKGLMRAYPNAETHVVEVGHKLTSAEVTTAIIHPYPQPYHFEEPPHTCPFDTDGTYERKAWITLMRWKKLYHPKGTILFWSVMGSPQ